MAAPQNYVAQNGISQISGDNLNTIQQWCPAVGNLRSFSGATNGMMVYLQGFTSAVDGGQGIFYWNSSSNATDDGGITAVVPNGSANGAWLRIPAPNVDTLSYQVPLTGFNITIPNYTNALILNPAGTLSSGTIIMPALLFNGQYVSISSSQTVTTLTVTPNTGQTVIGAPTTITSTTPVKWIYYSPLKTFFRGG